MENIQKKVRYFFFLQGIRYEENVKEQILSFNPSRTLKLSISFKKGKLRLIIEDLSNNPRYKSLDYISSFDKDFKYLDKNQFKYRFKEDYSNLFKITSSIVSCVQLFKKNQENYNKNHADPIFKQVPNRTFRFYDSKTFTSLTGQRTGRSFKDFFFLIEEDSSKSTSKIQCFYLFIEKNSDENRKKQGQFAGTPSEKKQKKAKLIREEEIGKKTLETTKYLIDLQHDIAKDHLGIEHISRYK